MSDQPTPRRMPSPMVLAFLLAVSILLPTVVSLISTGLVISDVSLFTMGAFALVLGGLMLLLLIYVVYVFYIRR